MSIPDSPQASSAGPSIFEGYVPRTDAYDELVDTSGRVREHWRPLAAGLTELGVEELDRRLTEARRLLRENGITYTTREDPGDARPWDVDLFPLMFDAAAMAGTVGGRGPAPGCWMRLSGTCIRRTTCWRGELCPRNCCMPIPVSCVLHRTTGARRLLLAPVRGRLDSHERRGVARCGRSCKRALGSWLRPGKPHRVSRMFPGMIRDCRIERLAPFFISLQKMLRDFAPQHRDNPRVVLLSEGSQSSRHFEDAYLARYLNYTLAEVGDLAVRHGYVTLKTLGGLLPVDVVFRRLSDTLCDPLEFQGDAAVWGCPVCCKPCRRPCGGGQCAGQLRRGDACAAAVSARPVSAAAAGGIAVAVGGNVVVRHTGRPPADARRIREPDVSNDLSGELVGGDVPGSVGTLGAGTGRRATRDRPVRAGGPDAARAFHRARAQSGCGAPAPPFRCACSPYGRGKSITSCPAG